MKNNIIFIVFLKEVKDLFRDKKTIMVNILIPLILFPIMFFVIGKSINNSTEKVKSNLKIAFGGSENSSIEQNIKRQSDIKVVSSKNIEQDIKDGKILVGVIIPENFDKLILDGKTAEIKIIYDDSSQQSQIAQGIIKDILNKYSKLVVEDRLKSKNIDPNIITPVDIEYKTISKENSGVGMLMLSMILPLLLLIYCITGPMAPAIDLGAGEKERGTLEPLLTTQAGRMSLLWGKFLAITLIGILSIVSAIVGIIISINQNDWLFSISGNDTAVGLNISIQSIVLIGVLTVLMIMVFGALELSISIYARSFKEAQTYLTPLNIIAIIPIYATYMLDAKNIENYYFSIPLANCVCLIKEFINGIFNYTHIAITFGWIGFYIILALFFAKYMFGREEVIFRI